LDYKECAGDDRDVKFGVPFSRHIKLRPRETVVFACILFKPRKAAAYDTRPPHARQGALLPEAIGSTLKLMKDPRLAASMDGKSMPFDAKRMVTAGSRHWSMQR
jgi:uncharacterized protein YbaA (DUF1428 family)